MAILINKRCLLVQIPRTASHWVDRVFLEYDLPNTRPVPKAACLRHALPRHFNLSVPSACVVRHPVEWIESYWKFQRPRTEPFSEFETAFKPGLWYPTKPFHPIPFEFFDFVQRVIDYDPGAVGRMMAAYADECDHVLRFDRIESEMAELLTYYGVPMTAEQLDRVCLQHVSRPVELDWTTDLMDEFERTEMAAIERWFDEH